MKPPFIIEPDTNHIFGLREEKFSGTAPGSTRLDTLHSGKG